MSKVRWQTAVFAILVVLLFAGAFDWLTDIMFTPWARATPPLLDEWVGRVTTGNGEQLAVVFALERARHDGGEGVCVRCAQIEGRAATCDARGNVRRYRVFGSPLDRAGHELRLGVTPARHPPPDGLEFSAVFGTWDHADTLALQAEFFWRRGRSAISSTHDPATRPVPLLMWRKGSRADLATWPCVP
jgi:hypothetical protein